MPSRAIKSLLAIVPVVLAAVVAADIIVDEERGEDVSIKVAGILEDTSKVGDRVGFVVDKSILEEASFFWP